MTASSKREEDFSTQTHNMETSPSSEPSQRESNLAEDSSHTDATKDIPVGDEVNAQKKGLPFYAIMLALCFAGLLTAMEATITSTALPSIVSELNGGDRYIWVVNGYMLAMTALQPLFGQISNIFGRRWPFIFSTAAFTLGSGICGGSSNIDMLIAGRVIQGIGASGINVIIEIIVCDLVPLRERGNYLAAIFGVVALGTALGPLFGGLIVQHISWRWVFYITLPVGGVALVLLLLFLKVRYNKDDNLATSLGKIDWAGNAIFVGAITAVLIALSWAGAVYPWTSYHVIVPLVIGMLGLVGFLFFEGSRCALQPMMPLHLMSNRTSATAYILTLLHSIVTMWALYFLPVYFQGVLGSTPAYSGEQLLPTILILIPFAAAGGIVMSKFGRYRPIQHVGFALLVIGSGLFSLLDENSSTGTWVGYQIIASAGAGLITPTVLPTVLAPLRDSDSALATATWAFCRSFGMTWGVAIAGAVFNNRFGQLASRITDPDVAAEVSGGNAYQFATREFLNTLSAETRAQFISVTSDSLRRTWQVSIAFAALGFLLVIIEKEIPLRKDLETNEYGMIEEKKKTKVASSLV